MQKFLKLNKMQSEIIKKVSKLELSILCTVCMLMLGLHSYKVSSKYLE